MIEACGRCNHLEKGKEVLELFEASPLFHNSTVEEKTKLYQTYETQIVAKENHAVNAHANAINVHEKPSE